MLLLTICLGIINLIVATSNAPQLNVVPYPSDVSSSTGFVTLDPKHFDFHIDECHADCGVVSKAFDRYSKWIFMPPGSTGSVYRLSIFENRIKAAKPTGTAGQLSRLSVVVKSKSAIELQLGADESYELSIPQGNNATATLVSDTVWGALRGLETFSQLIEFQSASAEGRSGFQLSWTPITIKDTPRYPWRGLLVDSARHYLSVPLLEKTIDTMAAMKLNTLHWHMVDAESFPFDSQLYPELRSKASYHPSATYSADTIRHLVSFARDRGVRILPEFDTPGHTAAIGQAFPDLVADCYDWMVTHYNTGLRWPLFDNVALDVTKDETKVFVKNIVTEMSTLFPDQYFHIGGDEVNQGCWNAVPSILSWMQENGFATQNAQTQVWTYDFTGLQGQWTTYVQQVTASVQRQAVVWEESFSLGFNLSHDSVVHIWIPDDGTDLLKRVIQSGHRVLLSNGWYLDRQAPTCVDDSQCSVNWMWIWSGRDMYAIEPLSPSTSGWVPNEEEAKLILGGEAASWGESVDDKNFDARVWSRAPGVAERLWSPSANTDPWLLQPRISSLACKLARRGVHLADSQPAFCDYYGGHL